MNTYIALIRGINVSGQKKITMVDLAALFVQMGFSEVKTYIQSGNVRFQSLYTDNHLMESEIERGILGTFGFQVSVLVLDREGLRSIMDKDPFKDLEEGRRYFVLLMDMPNGDKVQGLREQHFENERFAITDHCIYLFCKNGYGNTKCDNNFFERKLKVRATTRNLRTMQQLLLL
ncbi:MAG: DUF1697 domain-containing protein [Sediminicola sp.]